MAGRVSGAGPAWPAEMPRDPEWPARISVDVGERLLHSLTSLEAILRSLFRPPARILAEIGIATGQHVLDFGCGHGGMSVAAARIVGPRGKVYALSERPFVLSGVMRSAHRRGLANIVPLSMEGIRDIPRDSVDVALVFESLHSIPEPREAIQELYRIVSPEGFVCVRDARLGNVRIIAAMTAGGHFELFHHSLGRDRGHGFKKAQRVPLE